jgi:hypothetical protein
LFAPKALFKSLKKQNNNKKKTVLMLTFRGEKLAFKVKSRDDARRISTLADLLT